jgi:hypothetical protein
MSAPRAKLVRPIEARATAKRNVVRTIILTDKEAQTISERNMAQACNSASAKMLR